MPANEGEKRIGSDLTKKVTKFRIADASFEKSPGQDADVFVANLVDQRHGGPITIGYSRYAPNQTLTDTIAVHDVMIVLEGQLTVETSAGSLTAGPGEIVYMPQGQTISIRTQAQEAITAYVTYPHWQEA